MLELPEGVQPTVTGGREPLFANASKWVRAPEGGVFRTSRRIGEAVGQGETIGVVSNPYDDTESPVRSPRRGIIIGRTTLPIVNMGDALFHIAWSEELESGRPAREAQRDGVSEPVMDEDEII